MAEYTAQELSRMEDFGISDRKKENIKKWITRYRRNWDLFAEEVLAVKLYPLQKFSLHMIGISQEYNEISTRGAAKSFRIGLAAICAFCLYPYSEIVITSSTVSQASKLVERKIRDEIINKLSPYLRYMYEKKYITITKSSTDAGTYTIKNELNDSIIIVLPCTDSARGNRSTINIYEESRLLKKSLIDSVFEPMGQARRAKYLLNPKYNIPRWQEKPKSFYISSSRYAYEWFSKKFKDTVSEYYLSKHEKYIAFAQDIFTAIDDGVRTWVDYRKNKKSMSEMDFRMEILNEMFSEGENAFFNLQSFKENQEMTEGFRPPTEQDYLEGKPLSMMVKKADEIRLVVADLAFSGSYKKHQSNDNTIFICMSLHWDRYRFVRHIDYIESRPGGDSSKLVLRLKELFFDYQADYLIDDNRSGGEVIYDYLSAKTPHPARGERWNDSGFTVCKDLSLHVASDSKVGELAGRTVDKNAIPCLIPFVSSMETNSLMWQSLKKQLEINNIKFMISSKDYISLLEDTGEYFDLTSEQLAKKVMPYVQTDELISECVNLSAEYRNGLVKLTEPRQGFKDRAVALAYGNFIAEKIENKYNRQQQEEEFDMKDFQLVF